MPKLNRPSTSWARQRRRKHLQRDQPIVLPQPVPDQTASLLHQTINEGKIMRGKSKDICLAIQHNCQLPDPSIWTESPACQRMSTAVFSPPI